MFLPQESELSEGGCCVRRGISITEKRRGRGIPFPALEAHVHEIPRPFTPPFAELSVGVRASG